MIVFWCVVSLMIVLGWAIIFIPFFIQQKKVTRATWILFFILLLLLSTSVIVGYWRWGSYTQWTQYANREAHRAEVEKVLVELKNPQQLIDKLKQRLQQEPRSAQGWYLLGRLYFSLQRYQEAASALAKANTFKSNDTAIQLQYAQALFFTQHKNFAGTPMALIKAVLQREPDNAEALSLAAMAAYLAKDYEKAIAIWEKLLRTSPANSPDKEMLLRAIAKAQQALVDSRQSHPIPR